MFKSVKCRQGADLVMKDLCNRDCETLLRSFVCNVYLFIYKVLQHGYNIRQIKSKG